MNILRMVVFVIALSSAGCQSPLTTGGPLPREASVASIEPGNSKAAVRAALGNPDSIDVFRRLNEVVWRYLGLFPGDDEIWVTFTPDGTVSMVQSVPYVESNFGIFRD